MADAGPAIRRFELVHDIQDDTEEFFATCRWCVSTALRQPKLILVGQVTARTQRAVLLVCRPQHSSSDRVFDHTFRSALDGCVPRHSAVVCPYLSIHP
jgi:hypothetical protein